MTIERHDDIRARLEAAALQWIMTGDEDRLRQVATELLRYHEEQSSEPDEGLLLLEDHRPTVKVSPQNPLPGKASGAACTSRCTIYQHPRDRSL
jgi:hypothetical protein